MTRSVSEPFEAFGSQGVHVGCRESERRLRMAADLEVCDQLLATRNWIPAWEPFAQLDAIWIENRAMAAYACTRNLIMPLET